MVILILIGYQSMWHSTKLLIGYVMKFPVESFCSGLGIETVFLTQIKSAAKLPEYIHKLVVLGT